LRTWKEEEEEEEEEKDYVTGLERLKGNSLAKRKSDWCTDRYLIRY